jgi:outer membrane protein insertion porin family
MTLRKLLILSFLLFSHVHAYAAESFIVKDIKLLGLERIPDGTLLNYLPVKVGSSFDSEQTSYVIQELYKTGFFRDVKLLKDGNVLVVQVIERPAISNITWSGNSDIEDEQLEEILNDLEITKGRVFKPSALDKIEQGLKQQAYFSRGKYAVRIDTTITDLERNRVDIDIKISEGVIAKIKQVNIVGNNVFDDATLLEDLQLGVPGAFDFFSSIDEYAKPKLAGDEESIKSYYQDRGYVRFSMDSTQVTITPDKKDIYITLNVTEGEKYNVSEISFAGNLVVPESELRKLFLIKSGDVFSRNKMIAAKDLINRRLGNEGYAFAKVKAAPKINDETLQVELAYFIDPGKKVYVNRIHFTGNYKTNDEVLRRELRLMEGGELSNNKLERSKIRLQRLPYIEEVIVSKDPVAGTSDLVDLNISIKERMSGSFNIGAGLSQTQGFVFNLGLTMDNLNGTGESLAVNFNNDKANKVYSLSFTDPYHTIDAISRTIAFSYRERDAAEADISNYFENSYGANLSYGIPLTEYDRLRIGVGYEATDILRGGTNVSADVDAFLAEYTDGSVNANGDPSKASSDSYTLLASFSHDTRNRTIFATAGNSQSISLDFTLPNSDVEYYKITYRNKIYFPINRSVTTLVRTDVAYGDGYGDNKIYPFFERFYAGGLRTVRGFDSNSLGPRDNLTNKPIGGDIRTVASAEVIFPVPFMEKAPSSVRLSSFYDIGNVFLKDQGGFDSSELRSSVGVSFVWLAPIGPLRFSWARTLDEKEGDDTRAFQFSIGSIF